MGNAGRNEEKMKLKHAYRIIVGESGNEQGHVRVGQFADDAAAIRAAKRDAKCYGGDGWWRVECAGATVARGGRDNY